MDNEITTMSVRQLTKERLDKLKIHPNQSYDEIINEIIDKMKGGR